MVVSEIVAPKNIYYACSGMNEARFASIGSNRLIIGVFDNGLVDEFELRPVSSNMIAHEVRNHPDIGVVSSYGVIQIMELAGPEYSRQDLSQSGFAPLFAVMNNCVPGNVGEDPGEFIVANLNVTAFEAHFDFQLSIST